MPNLYAGIKPPYRSGQRLLCLCTVFLLPLLVFAQPSISTVTPLSGPVGTAVTITGNNFNATPSSNVVRFGSVNAQVVNASATSLTVTVPNGTSYAPITVTTGGLTAYYYKPFSTTFLDPGQFTASSFASTANFPTDYSPQSIVCMDFDGDGSPDIAVANTGGPSVSVYRNTSTIGTPSFTTQYDTVQDLSYGPFGIAAGDLDGDGKPDLVMANNYSNFLRVFQNTSTVGQISMKELPALTQGNTGSWVAIGDCNGDGKPEILCVNQNDDDVVLYTNTSTVGTISFGVHDTLLAADPALPWSVAIADIDGDGMPDIIMSDWNTSLVSVFRNTGTRGGPLSFSPEVPFAVGQNPMGVAVGDLDGDGLPEVITTNATDNTVSILHNTSTIGNISMVRGTDLPTGNWPTAVAVGDLDGDGHPDLAISNYGDNTASVLRNTSTPGTISMAARVDYAVDYAPWDIAIADMDGNGMPDIITPNSNNQDFSVLINQSPTSPAIASFAPNTGSSGTQVTITGINFTGATSVSFGGVPAASFNVVSSTSITAVVAGGATGNVSVVTPNGAASLGTFTYGAVPLPVITSFTPMSATYGTTVTINGSNLSQVTGVSFGSENPLSFTIVSDSEITAVVDTGATGDVVVEASAGNDTVTGFTYIAPAPLTITNFSPVSGPQGTVVSITGSGLSTNPAVFFGGVPAANVNVISDNLIKAVVGSGATGSVTVTSFNGADSLSAFTFLASGPPPALLLTSCTPLSGGTGASITINGSDLSSATSVTFGGVPAASFTIVSDSQIVATLGAGATGDVRVANTGSADSIPDFVFTYDTTKTAPQGAFQLVTFTGALTAARSALQWQTVNDGGVAYYAIERGVDGSNFTTIGTVKSKAAGGLGYAYTYTDSLPKPGVNFYRIKVQDTTALYSYSAVIQIQLLSMTMPVYPNPVKYGFFLVDLPSIKRPSIFQLTNTWGMIVQTIQVPAGVAQQRINLPELLPGTYRLSWTDGVSTAYQTILVLYR